MRQRLALGIVQLVRRMRMRPMALRVATVMLELKAIVVSPESAPDLILSPARQAINVTTPEHAIPKRESVRIRKKRMAARAMTATPALKVTLVSPAHAS